MVCSSTFSVNVFGTSFEELCVHTIEFNPQPNGFSDGLHEFMKRHNHFLTLQTVYKFKQGVGSNLSSFY